MSAQVKPAFWTWLMRQKDRDDPVGDLARDASGDERKKFRRPQGAEAPGWLASRPKTPKNLREYMLTRSACSEAFNALDEAVEQWRDYRRHYNK
jgi:hypothetical protein